jgi:hypothetical protein
MVRTHVRAVDTIFYSAERDGTMCSYRTEPEGAKIVVFLIGEEDDGLLR